MIFRILALTIAFALGATIGHLGVLSHLPLHAFNSVMAQSQKHVTMVHLYTGSDNQTHAEEVDGPFHDNVFEMFPVVAAELHTAAPGTVVDWHVAPFRQYVITLSGRAELEVANGKKIPLEPGEIEYIEDTSGKGHITRTIGTEDRVSLWLKMADQNLSTQ